MTKQQKISDFTAGKAIKALEEKLPALKERLQAVEVELQGPQAVKVQETMGQAAELKREIQEINTAVTNVKQAQKETVEVGGGGCAG